MKRLFVLLVAMFCFAHVGTCLAESEPLFFFFDPHQDPLAPRDALLVSESGLKDGADLRRLRERGFHGFLIGESLMRARDPGAALRDLRS